MGWCDLIARQWPVDAVIGENGALAFWERDRHLHRLFHPDVADGGVRSRLDAVRDHPRRALTLEHDHGPGIRIGTEREVGADRPGPLHVSLHLRLVPHAAV